MSKAEIDEAFKDELFIKNVCFSYDHSYGLRNEEQKANIQFECKEWMRAIANSWEYRKLRLDPDNRITLNTATI